MTLGHPNYTNLKSYKSDYTLLNKLRCFLCRSQEKLVELRKSVENYIDDNPDDIQSALKHIKEKVDEALKG